MVVIVLLNVLIAIVSDSYEKCLIRSNFLFGRARVMLIAELVSFQNLLRIEKDGHSLYSKWWSGEVWHRWSRGSVCFFLLSSVVVAIWIVGESAGYFASERKDRGNYIYRLLSLIVIVALFLGILVFLLNAGDEKKSTTWYNKFVQKAMLRLLRSSEKTAPIGRNGDYRDEWRGRVDFLTREMFRLTSDSNAQMSLHVGALKNYMNASSIDLRQEIGNVESQLADLKEEVMMELKQMEARNAHLIRETLMDVLERNALGQQQPLRTRSSSVSSPASRSLFKR